MNKKAVIEVIVFAALWLVMCAGVALAAASDSTVTTVVCFVGGLLMISKLKSAWRRV